MREDSYTQLLNDNDRPPTPPDISMFIDNAVLINDNFLIEIYNYYFGQGFLCILIDNLLNIFGLLFLILYSVFLFECVDYHTLYSEHNLRKAVQISNIKNASFFTIICMIMTSFIFIYKLSGAYHKIKRTRKVKDWYVNNLNIDETEIKFTKWSTIIDKLIELSDNKLFTKINKLDIINRIMRKNNYFIAMVDLNILDLNIYIPFYGEYSFLSKYLEWNIHKCISNFVFDSNSQIKKVFLQTPNSSFSAETLNKLQDELRKRFLTMTIINLTCLPFILLFQLTYFFFKYAEEYRRDPHLLGLRQYSHYSRWKFREYNELPHIFEQRLNMSYDDANKYISHFSNKISVMIKQFIVFIASSFIIFLTIISIQDEDILFNEVTSGKSVLWYIGILGGIIGLCKFIRTSDDKVYKPDVLLKRVSLYTHYYPENWIDKEYHTDTYQEFSKFFQIKFFSLLEELFSFIITPYILYFKLRKDTNKIVDFFINYTSYNNNVGNMCSFASMVPTENISDSHQEKIKKSQINFDYNYNCSEELINNNTKNICNKNLSLIKEDNTQDNSVLSLGLSILQINDECKNDNEEIIIEIKNDENPQVNNDTLQI
jgi:autophagy-related protein 9|tara:strand:+ start:3439 stop:5235 length:1797 start_codon:yes stop_codon:yes gene_type:complete